MAVLSGEALLLLALLTLTPGADTFLTLRQALVGGLRLAWPTIAGIATGVVAHSALSGAGLAILFEQSPAAFRAVQLAGVGYLAFLGVRSLRAALAKAAPAPPALAGGGAGGRPAAWRGFRDGLATNLLNPKVALFYLAFLSPYIEPGQPILLTSLLYGIVHALMGELQLGTVAVLADRVRARLASPRLLRASEAVAGSALLLFAARLAFAHS